MHNETSYCNSVVNEIAGKQCGEKDESALLGQASNAQRAITWFMN